MKIYRYESTYETCMIVEKENSAEIWIYTAVHTFFWKLHNKPKQSIVEWFIEVTKLNSHFCSLLLCPPGLFQEQDFAKEQLLYCLETISKLTSEDFYEYIRS